MSSIEKLKESARLLPEKPGVYLFKDNQGKILYAGKAKSLKKRVLSYFSGKSSGKTVLMLRKSASVSTIIVESEGEALLLENNIIKEHQPRYNILLKDDKTFPWICIRNERLPRIYMTRQRVNDGSEYFGPYTSVVMVRTLLGLIRQLYPQRNCNLSLSEESVRAGKFKVCLEYHLGNCLAPCVGKQSEEEYNIGVSDIRNILKGNINGVLSHLTLLMKRYSEELRFEEAQLVKEKIGIIARYKSKSTVVNNTIKNSLAVGYTESEEESFINAIRIIDGAVINSYTLTIKSIIEEDRSSILGTAIVTIMNLMGEGVREVIMPFRPDIAPEGVKAVVPVRGDKLKLVQLAERNAVQYRLEQKRRQSGQTREDRDRENLERLKSDLRLATVPLRIECFDNSNIQGSNPVAACVVFRNGKPSRKDYRHYNIKTVTGPDDYASMEEVVHRRYKRLLDEGSRLPDLIVIDGGKGQLGAAYKSLVRLDLHKKLPVIGIAKRLEEIYYPNDPVPLYINKNSVSLKIIQHLRNEAHRFGINFHRNKRSGEMLKSSITEIKGIGEATLVKLIKRFRSVDGILKAGPEIVAEVVGEAKSKLIFEQLGQ